MTKKIISVHGHECKTRCQHADICYLVNGKHFSKPEKTNRSIESVINNITFDYDVFYSCCNYSVCSILTHRMS